MKAKKTIAGVLAFSLLVTAAASMQASAADATVTLAATHETVDASGDAFSVDVSIADVPATKVSVLDFALTYDASVLTVSNVTIGAAADTDVSGDTTAADAPVFAYYIHDGEIAVNWSTGLGSDAWIADDGIILTISGTVNEGVAEGTVTPIDFAPITRETYEGSGEMNDSMLVGVLDGTNCTLYDLNTEAGSVTVGGETVTTTEPIETTEPDETTTEPDETTTEPDETTESSETDAPVTTTTGGGAVGTICGDVNLDDEVNMADVICLNKAAINIVDLSDTGRKNGDCNVDGEVDGNDAMILLRFQVQLIDSLPYIEGAQ